MTEIDVVVRHTGNSIDLRVPKAEARRLGLAHGRRLRIVIPDDPDVVDLIGALKGRINVERALALGEEGEDLD